MRSIWWKTPTTSQIAHRAAAKHNYLVVIVLLLAFIVVFPLKFILTRAPDLPAATPIAPQAMLAQTFANEIADGDIPFATLVAVTPPIARPGTAVTITVRVTNASSEPVFDLVAELRIGWQRIVTRSALVEWAETDITHSALLVESQSVPELMPGASTEIVFSFAADTLGFAEAHRGPREMSIVLLDGTRTKLSQLHSFFIWDPAAIGTDSAGHQVPISLLAPVTLPAVNPADAPAEIAPSLGGTQRLASVVQAVSVAAAATEVPDALSLAIDPALLGYVSEIDSYAAINWLDNVSLAAEQTAVFALPPFDPDLAALAHADLRAFEIAQITSVPLPNDFEVPENWYPPIAWPADFLVPDIETHNAATNSGIRLMVNPAGSRAIWGTISGIDQINTPGGPLNVLINDVPLADAFTMATGNSPAEQAISLQRVLAETVVVAEQTTTIAPHLLIALPRNWQPQLATLFNALATMAESGWITISPITELLAAPIPTNDRIAIPPRLVHQNELPPDTVRELLSAFHQVESFGAIAEHPYQVIADAEAAIVMPLSLAWRNHSNSDLTRNDLVVQALQNVGDIREQLSVSASGLTLISAEGSIPLLVHNGFDSAVTVSVVLEPADSRLLVDERPTVTVPEQTTMLVYVPVRAIASGDVEVDVQLRSADGAIVATGGTLDLRVRAGWETVGTGVVMAVLGVLLVVGIVRTVRRGRSPRRTSAASAPYPRIYEPSELP